MTELLKSAVPYVLLIALMILTLCTREKHTATAKPQSVEAADSLAADQPQNSEEVAYQVDQPLTER